MAIIDEPRVFDAVGEKVESIFNIQDNKLKQNVAHNNNYQYPIKSDVNIYTTVSTDFFYYFTSGNWINRDGKYSLSLLPNYDSWNTSSSWYNTAWDTVVTRHSGDSQWYNAQSLYSQFVCHVKLIVKDPSRTVETILQHRLQYITFM